MSTPSTLEQQLEANAQNAPMLGYIVTWGASKTVISAGDLKAALEAHGFLALAESLEPIKTKQAIIRALQAMSEDGVVKTVLDISDRAVYALANVKTDWQEEDLDFTTNSRVIYYKQTQPGSPNLDFKDGMLKDGTPRPLGSARAEILPQIEHYKESYLARDVTSQVFLKAVKQMSAISIKDNGGCYFVAADHQGALKDLRTLAKDLAAQTGSDVYFSMLAVPDLETSKEDMGRHAISALKSEMKLETIELRKMVKRMTQDGMHIKDKTVVDHLLTVDEIQKRAEMFRDLLLLDIAEINQELGKMRKSLGQVKEGDNPFAEQPVPQAEQSLIDEMIAGLEPEPPAEPEKKAPTTWEEANPF